MKHAEGRHTPGQISPEIREAIRRDRLRVCECGHRSLYHVHGEVPTRCLHCDCEGWREA